MNKTIILIGLICLLLVGGCVSNSSFDDCMKDCKKLFKTNFTEYKACKALDYQRNRTYTYDCNKIHYDELRLYCFEECKGVK